MANRMRASSGRNSQIRIGCEMQRRRALGSMVGATGRGQREIVEDSRATSGFDLGRGDWRSSMPGRTR